MAGLHAREKIPTREHVQRAGERVLTVPPGELTEEPVGEENPLPLICGDLEMARKIGQFNITAEKLAEAFWPGPLMFILPSKVIYPMWVSHGKKTIGLRVPGSEVSRKLAELSGGVIVSTSANKSGEPPATTAKEALSQTGFKVDLVLDGGPSPGGQSSTIIDLSGKEMWILRSGPITGTQIMEALKR